MFHAMGVTVTWQDIALRLTAAVVAGGLVGFDRSLRGRIAGLRTTILMCVAAAAAMIEANLMLQVGGKVSSSFTVLDALRFPLGILSGIGFIGAGAIVRRGHLVTGVTTAATLWLVTVIGLLLGGGYILTGGTVTLVAFFVLRLLKDVESQLSREHRSHLIVRLDGTGPANEALRQRIKDAGYTITSLAAQYDGARRIDAHLEWFSPNPQDHIPELVEQLADVPGVIGVEWLPVSAGHLFE